MSKIKQAERDFEFISSQFLSADLPNDWFEMKAEKLYDFLKENAWYPYEDWDGEKIFGAIEDLAVDMRAYIELERRISERELVIERLNLGDS